MARDTNFNNPARQVIQTNEDQRKYDLPTFRRMEVNAQVRNQYVEPTSNNALVLATSLAAASPGITQWLAVKGREKDEEETQKGMQARNAAGDLTDEQATELAKVSSSGYQKGYMRLHGYLAGKEDATKLQTDWQADPERNGISTDEWIKNWYAKNTKGLSDGDFLTTYNKEVLTEADKLRAIGRDEKVASVIQATDGAVTQYIKEKILSGEFNRDVFEGASTDAQKIWGISKGKFDDLALAATNQIIEEGKNPTPAKVALSVFKENKSDGTPGLAYKGKMLADGTIDQMVRKADQISIQSLEYEDKAARLGREKDREEGMKAVFTEMLVNNNPEKGRQMAIALIKNNPKLFDSKEILQTMSTINTQMNKVETTGMKVNALSFLSKAYDGDLTINDVARGVESGKISFSQAPTLIGAIKAYDAKDNALFKTPEFQAGDRLLNSIQPPRNGLDIDGSVKLKFDERRIQDQLALKQYVKGGGKDPLKFAQDLHKTEMQYLQSGNTDDEITYFVPTYPTKAAMTQAIEGGLVIPQDVFDKHIRYFSAGLPKPKQQKTK